ncbi:Arsenate reductase [subsurface metagenome]
MERSKEMVVLQKGILFLCTGNSCRSQMAEGFARKMLPKNMEILSAGLELKGVHPMAVKVMQEIGVDISHQKSKNISEIPIDKIDLVVTLCGDAAERCPIFPGKVERIHWEIEDPAKAQGSDKEIAIVFRKVRNKIRSYMENEKWFDSLKID